MSMADKKRKLIAQRQGQHPEHGFAHQPAPLKPVMVRASVMVLATQDESDMVTRALPEGPGDTLAPETGQVEMPEDATAAPLRLQIARVQPSIPAEKLGATLDRLLQGLQAKGAGTRTLHLSIPYSLRLDAELYQILHAQPESAAAAALEAFRQAPQDNLDAVTGAAALVAERRRRPSKGGLGQAGTVTMTLDGPQSETLEVLARRSGLSCGAFLEGATLIWAARHGHLDLESN